MLNDRLFALSVSPFNPEISNPFVVNALPLTVRAASPSGMIALTCPSKVPRLPLSMLARQLSEVLPARVMMLMTPPTASDP